MLFNSHITPSVPVRALPTHLCHSRNSSAWRRQAGRTSPHQREANLANIQVVGWVMGNNKEELGENAPQLTQLFTFQTKWWAGVCLLGHQQRDAQKGTHLGCCCRIPFMKSFASSLKWTTSGMVHEISPFWIFRRVFLSFSPANGDLHVRLIYWTP